MIQMCYLLARIMSAKVYQSVKWNEHVLVGSQTKKPNKTYVLRGFLTGASNRVRTDDLMITNQVLYQLSYAGVKCVKNSIDRAI